MARNKVRNFKPREFYEQEAEEYFRENRSSVIHYTLKQLGFETEEELHDAEMSMRFGGDCGLVYLVPVNGQMFHEWQLDNGKYSEKVYIHGPFGTQSTTIQRCFAEKLIEDKDWNDIFYIGEWLN